MFTESEWARITRYLTGECSPAEQEKIESWIEADARRQACVEKLKRAWDASDAEPRPRDIDAAWGRMQERMEEEEREQHEADAESDSGRSPVERAPRSQPRARRTRRRWVSAGIIAVTLLCAAAAVILFTPQHDAPAPPEPRVVSTASGEQTEVQLSDSSTVQLNAASQLTVSPSFGEDERVVRLEGEAYFDVTAGSPFIVEARDTRVLVLGTAFGVRSYSSDDSVSVVVAEGEVGVDVAENGPPEETLSPQQRAVVSSTGGIQVSSNVPVERHLSWRSGRLVFQGTPLRSVRRSLERQYGVQTFLMDDALSDRKLTATFTDESLSDVLKVVSLSLDIGYRRSDSTVVFGRPERNNLNVPSPAPSPSH